MKEVNSWRKWGEEKNLWKKKIFLPRRLFVRQEHGELQKSSSVCFFFEFKKIQNSQQNFTGLMKNEWNNEFFILKRKKKISLVFIVEKVSSSVVHLEIVFKLQNPIGHFENLFTRALYDLRVKLYFSRFVEKHRWKARLLLDSRNKSKIYDHIDIGKKRGWKQVENSMLC